MKHFPMEHKHSIVNHSSPLLIREIRSKRRKRRNRRGRETKDMFRERGESDGCLACATCHIHDNTLTHHTTTHAAVRETETDSVCVCVDGRECVCVSECEKREKEALTCVRIVRCVRRVCVGRWAGSGHTHSHDRRRHSHSPPSQVKAMDRISPLLVWFAGMSSFSAILQRKIDRYHTTLSSPCPPLSLSLSLSLSLRRLIPFPQVGAAGGMRWY
jgi:hypothetical protein